MYSSFPICPIFLMHLDILHLITYWVSIHILNFHANLSPSCPSTKTDTSFSYSVHQFMIRKRKRETIAVIYVRVGSSYEQEQKMKSIAAVEGMLRSVLKYPPSLKKFIVCLQIAAPPTEYCYSNISVQYLSINALSFHYFSTFQQSLLFMDKKSCTFTEIVF